MEFTDKERAYLEAQRLKLQWNGYAALGETMLVDMIPGKDYYTISWAVNPQTFKVNGTVTAISEPRGTASMKIYRAHDDRFYVVNKRVSENPIEVFLFLDIPE